MPANKLRGKAWVFEGILDVDWEICPFAVRQELVDRGIPITEEALGKYCMTTVDPEFPRKVKKGDFIIAGENMGYGHDHDHATLSLKGAGVAAVLCESTNGNFMRNSVEMGLPVVECPGIMAKVRAGDEIEVDLAAGVVRDCTSGVELSFTPYPDFLLDMLEAGGLYPHLKKQLNSGKSQPKRDGTDHRG